jgi:hypothetical protein
VSCQVRAGSRGHDVEVIEVRENVLEDLDDFGEGLLRCIVFGLNGHLVGICRYGFMSLGDIVEYDWYASILTFFYGSEV